MFVVNKFLMFYHGRRRTTNLGTVNFQPEKSNRAGEQAEKLHDFPIVLSENLSE